MSLNKNNVNLLTKDIFCYVFEVKKWEKNQTQERLKTLNTGTVQEFNLLFNCHYEILRVRRTQFVEKDRGSDTRQALKHILLLQTGFFGGI